MIIRQKSWIEEANTKIDIADFLSSIGIYVPVRDGNKKVHCPFGFYHSDGGQSKAMRIYYNSNTAFCFSCGKRYTPVTLASAYWDCAWVTAAFRLLDDAGIKPKTLEERWVEASTPEIKKIDLISLADALKMFCAGVSTDWDKQQYSDEISDKLNKCLTLLDSIKTDEDAVKWLNVCKQVMAKMLEEK